MDQAERHYAAILAVRANHFDAMHLSGVVRLQQGRNLEALDQIRAALDVNPRSAEAWSNLGIVFANLRRPEEAVASYDKALAIKAAYPEALYNRGAALRDLKRPEEAVASYDRAIAFRPRYAEALYNRGLALKELGRPEAALTSYDRALAVRPDYAEAHNNRGAALQDLKRHEEAVASYDRALVVRPDYAEAHNNRGAALQELKRHEEALASYDRALALKPNYAEALFNRGNALRGLGRSDEALASYERALALKPDYLEALYNRGVALQDLKRSEEALASYDLALALRPDYAEAHNNRGFALRELDRHEEALASYDRALALKPDYAEARLNRALHGLLTGDFGGAWPDYECRWRVKDAPARKLVASYPEWSGEDVRDKRIIIYEEQGLGDVVQMSRFLPAIAARGAHVTFLLRPSMHRVLGSSLASVRLLDRVIEGETFDFQCALMSVPGAFGATHQNLPSIHPYLFAEEAAAAHWARRVGAGGLKIGICWQGSNDVRADSGRSVSVRQFAPLAAIPGVRLISLQKVDGLDQLSDLPPDMKIETPGVDFDAGRDAFVDTAAVMSHLDLIVTVDTSIAHLAGALGRPVWLALKQTPDWRWMLHRPDTPWYPSMRLYRQQAHNDWGGVFERIARDVAGLSGGAQGDGIARAAIGIAGR